MSEVAVGLTAAEERFARILRQVGLWLGPALLAGIWAAPLPLPGPEKRLLAVLGLVLVYWVSEAMPLPATAVLGPSLVVVLGVAGAREAFAAFADPVIFLFLGSFLLAEALAVHGLDRRMALRLLSLPGVARSPLRVRAALGGSTAAISAWMSNTATAAMMLPMALGLVRAARAAGSGEPARAALLAVSLAASIGGVATPVGTPPNLIVLGALDRLAGLRVSFGAFMVIGVPIALALMVAALTVLRRFHPPPREGVDLGGYVEHEKRALPAWGRSQTACAAAFALAVAGWVGPSVAGALGARAPSQRLEESVVAVLAASLLFLWPAGETRVLTWKHASRIDWGTLLLFGGGLSLGKLMFDLGLAERFARVAAEATGVSSLWGLTALAVGCAIALSEITSNTAAAGMLAPLFLAMANEVGVPAAPPMLGVALGASMGLMLPIATPPNAMVFGTGQVPITAMARVGLALDLTAFVVILAWLRIACPALGLA
jgi:sodium-dependent dicarboxylate transporter 2/3/5